MVIYYNGWCCCCWLFLFYLHFFLFILLLFRSVVVPFIFNVYFLANKRVIHYSISIFHLLNSALHAYVAFWTITRGIFRVQLQLQWHAKPRHFVTWLKMVDVCYIHSSIPVEQQPFESISWLIVCVSPAFPLHNVQCTFPSYVRNAMKR